MSEPVAAAGTRSRAEAGLEDTSKVREQEGKGREGLLLTPAGER